MKSLVTWREYSRLWAKTILKSCYSVHLLPIYNSGRSRTLRRSKIWPSRPEDWSRMEEFHQTRDQSQLEEQCRIGCFGADSDNGETQTVLESHFRSCWKNGSMLDRHFGIQGGKRICTRCQWHHWLVGWVCDYKEYLAFFGESQEDDRRAVCSQLKTLLHPPPKQEVHREQNGVRHHSHHLPRASERPPPPLDRGQSKEEVYHLSRLNEKDLTDSFKWTPTAQFRRWHNGPVEEDIR